MKKALNKKLSSSKLVRKVLSRNGSTTQQLSDGVSAESSMTETLSLDASSEISSLQSEISQLKSRISSLEKEGENKDRKLSELAREKEILLLDLLRSRRSTISLSKQLDDERKFYYREKEEYCQEMNQVKKLKKVLSGASSLNKEIDQSKELEKLRKTLEQALHTNYNLSVKYLKIKESKNDLKTVLENARQQNRIIIEDLRCKIETLTRQLDEMVGDKFRHETISPSSRKYLQLVHQNSALVYENLCLQMQVEQMHKTKMNNEMKKREKVRKKRQSDGKTTTTSSTVVTSNESNQKIITIFEREKSIGQPTLTILDENELVLRKRQSCSVGRIRMPEQSESKLTVFQVSAIQSQTSTITTTTALRRKRSRSAPKIIQSVCLRDMLNIK